MKLCLDLDLFFALITVPIMWVEFGTDYTLLENQKGLMIEPLSMIASQELV
jgi:hypothetical protein